MPTWWILSVTWSSASRQEEIALLRGAAQGSLAVEGAGDAHSDPSDVARDSFWKTNLLQRCGVGALQWEWKQQHAFILISQSKGLHFISAFCVLIKVMERWKIKISLIINDFSPPSTFEFTFYCSSFRLWWTWNLLTLTQESLDPAFSFILPYQGKGMGVGWRKIWNLVSAEYLGQPSLALGRWGCCASADPESIPAGAIPDSTSALWCCAFTLWDWMPKSRPSNGSGGPNLLVGWSGKEEDQWFSKKQLFSM